MSECDSSDRTPSVLAASIMNFFYFFDFSQTATWICFTFCVDVPCLFVKISVLPPFQRIMGYLSNSLKIFFKTRTINNAFLVWNVPRRQVSSLSKFGHCN